MGSRAKTFFTEADQQRIEEAIRTAECRTIGEVAVMVAEGSDDYADAEVLAAVFLAGFVSLLVTEAFLNASLWHFILITLLLFVPARLLVRKLPAMKLSLVSMKRRETAVRHRAVRAFYEKGLDRTRQKTGVLFFLSLLEHRVWVLADKGINEKIDQKTLNAFAQNVSRGIREGHACDALCRAIRDAGNILAEHFPIAPHDTNELPDKVITD